MNVLKAGKWLPCMLLGSLLLASTGSNSAVRAQEADTSGEGFSQADLNFFETRIRPVLIDKCYRCHSTEAKSLGGGLSLESREGLLRGGDSGAAVEPGNAADSLLMLAISYEDDDYAMPPRNAGGKLPEEVIKDFRRWIQRGMADPREEQAAPPDRGAGDAARSWWAFQPLSHPEPPSPQTADWSSDPIDQFILHRLEARQLRPVDAAEPATLIRRIHFDLIGLPPEPDAAQQFVEAWNSASNSDEQQALYEQVVDRLLASDQFGEHWGRHWLDVARYAESSGKDVNVLYPLAWRYRDYVIDAFNSDLPYDQFVREQIAGDLLESDSDAEAARKWIATGFLAIGPKSINDQNPRQLALDIADEQIDAVSQAFLGVTIACARCHDHKFDPISQVDYTAMAGIFLSTETHYGTTGGVGGRNAGSLAKLPIDGETASGRTLSPEEVRRRRDQLKQLEEERQELIVARRRDRNQADQNGNPILRLSNQITGLKTQLGGYDERGYPIAQAMAVSDKPAAIPRSGRFNPLAGGRRSSGFVSIGDSPLFIRGETDRPSDRVPRGLPELFADVPTPTIPRTASGREQLSQWITDPSNPLVSRVMVNRMWHWLFGAGLVTSVDNFGTTGSQPTHPELLDYLANDFVQSGWSMKSMIRQMVTSRTYQLSSTYDETAFAADPGNTLLWRHRSKRLEAESIRDAILSASRQLDLERPKGSAVARAGDGVVGRPRFGLSEDSIVNDKSTVRSIYLPMTRDVTPEILDCFDFPDGSAVQGARQSTNVPSQALFMLNSDFVEEQSKRIAARITGRSMGNRSSSDRMRGAPRTSAKSVEEFFNELCWLIYSRPATTKETAAAKKLFLRHRDNPLDGAVSIIRAMLASAEFRSLD